MSALSPPSPPRSTGLRHFSVAEYHRLIADGFFGPEEQCELVEGLLRVKDMPRDPIHDAIVEIVAELLRSKLPTGWRARVEGAITTGDSQPEPDVAIVSGRPQNHLQRHPASNELALVIEVSNTSLAFDREVKSRVYARAGIPLYWVVNLMDRQIEVYSEPSGDNPEPAYRQRIVFATDDLVPLIIAGVNAGTLRVSDVIP